MRQQCECTAGSLPKPLISQSSKGAASKTGVLARAALVAALAAGRTLVVDRYALSGAAFTAAKGLPGLDLAWCQVPGRPDPTCSVLSVLRAAPQPWHRTPESSCTGALHLLGEAILVTRPAVSVELVGERQYGKKPLLR